jgi:hypothetical protein
MGEIGLDYLDLYLVHAPWPWDDVGKDCREENRQIWKAMEEFLAGGRVKAIGVSNFGPEDLDSLLPACETKPMVNQIRWFIGLDPSDTVQKCAEHDIVVEAYSPFAHGLIVNHPEIADIAARYDVSAPQLCIRYRCKRAPSCCPRRLRPRTSSRMPNSTSRFPPSTWASSTPCATPRSTTMRWSSAGSDRFRFRGLLPSARASPACVRRSHSVGQSAVDWPSEPPW